MMRRGIAGVLMLLTACSDASNEPAETEASSSGDNVTSTTSAGDMPATGGSSDAMTSGADDSSTSAGDSTGDGPPPSGPQMPAGIPFPSFGYDVDTTGAATLWVDNTNPACDDSQGTQAAPRCDLFAGGDTLELDAGTVVEIAGGPYMLGGDKVLQLMGTEDAPVVVRGAEGSTPQLVGGESRVRIEYQGQYAVLDNLEFVDRTQHQITDAAHHITLRRVQIHNRDGVFIDFNPVLNIAGHDVLVHDSRIYDNRRENDTDSHGVQAWRGSYNVWLLDNELFNNNGDSFQSCHECFEDTPHHIYIGRNEMHEDRENGVDLKTIHDVVVSENTLWGYGGSNTSAGDAMVIGSNGFDDATNQGPRNVWVLNNEFRDSPTGLRIEGVEDAWLIGNVFAELDQGLQIDNKEYRDVVIAGNTFDTVGGGIYSYNSSCSADSVTMASNIFSSVDERHVDVPDCPAWTLTGNLFDGVSVRFAGANETTIDAVNGLEGAMGNLEGAPQYQDGGWIPDAASSAVDAGTDLGPYLEAVESAYGGDAHFDRVGTTRPSGAAYDIGAYEQ